jgi:hypothetical protein
MTQADRPTFVLGVGAQKAGTTWLANHLKSSPEFENGFRKEYHVFDALDLATEDWMRRRITRLARESVEAFAQHEQADARVLHRLAMVVDLNLYYEYFASLVRRPDAVRATGDLTPDYAMLSADRMASIRQAFRRRGLRTAAVFLMRDPVDRVWSQIRMKAHRHPQWYDRSPEDELLAEHADPRYVRRTRYEETLAALDATFAADDVHVGLYETLFADATQAHAICRTVGITPHDPDLDEARNASPRAVDVLPEHVARPVAEFYADTYRAVARLRPDLDVERHWPHARWVL